MRFGWSSFLSIAVFALASQAGGALPITTYAGGSPPTTAPAQSTAVMLLPFHRIGQNNDNAWIADAINEDLSHDLSRNSAVRVIRPAATLPISQTISASDNVDVARQANAAEVISGSYQVVDDQLRITGEVTDVAQNKSAGQIKATGHVRDLFQLEDALSTQLWRILPRPAEDASASDIQVTPLEDYVGGQQIPPASTAQSDPVQPAVEQAPVVYQSAPADVDYPYASYGYGYPYGFGYPLIIEGGFGRGHFHHGDTHHGVYVGGNAGVGTRFLANGNVASPRTEGSHFAPADSGARFMGGHR